MRTQIITTAALFVLASQTTSWARQDQLAPAPQPSPANPELSPYQPNPPPDYSPASSDLYQAQELSLDAFGTAALDEHSIDHLSGARVHHDTRLGAGLGLNYFFLRYLGVGGEVYSENTSHSFVNNAEGNIIGRLPIGNTGLAPYAFAGAGHKFAPVIETFGQVGAGLEYRFTHNFGLFVDARYVFADRTRDYGLGRFGVRWSF